MDIILIGMIFLSIFPLLLGQWLAEDHVMITFWLGFLAGFCSVPVIVLFLFAIGPRVGR